MPKQERRCVACRQTNNQENLIRVARVNGKFVLDKNHKLGGRGAYICKSEACINSTIKKHLLNRAFKCNVDVSVYEELKTYEQSD